MGSAPLFFRAIVHSAASATGVVTVTIPDFAGSAVYQLSMIGRGKAADSATYLVPAVGKQIWVMLSDAKPSHVVWMGEGFTSGLTGADIAASYYSKTQIDASFYTKTVSDARYVNESDAITASGLTLLAQPDADDLLMVHDISDPTDGVGGTLKKTPLSDALWFYGAQRRNLLDNASGLVSVRGDSLSAIGSGVCLPDRWQQWRQSSGGSWAQSRYVLYPPGLTYPTSPYSIRITTITGYAIPSPAGNNDWMILRQGIEGSVLQHLKWGTSEALPLTLSFWSRHSVVGTYTVELETTDTANNRICASYTQNVANDFEYKTITFPGLTTTAITNDSNVRLALFFWIRAGSNYRAGPLNTSWGLTTSSPNRATGMATWGTVNGHDFILHAPQLEIGTRATRFEAVPLPEETSRCQRYLRRFTQPPLRGVVGAGTASGRMGMPLSPPMAGPATVSWVGPLHMYDGAAANTVASVGANISTNGESIEMDITSSGAWSVTGRACVMYQVPGDGYMQAAYEI